MFNQPLLPCRGSVIQAAARGRAVPGLEIAPIDRAPTSSYYHSIVTMSLFCTVCEI